MRTVNISIPLEVKQDLESFVNNGHFVSIDEVVKNAIKSLKQTVYLNNLVREAKKAHKNKQTTVLRNVADIDAYIARFDKKT